LTDLIRLLAKQENKRINNKIKKKIILVILQNSKEETRKKEETPIRKQMIVGSEKLESKDNSSVNFLFFLFG